VKHGDDYMMWDTGQSMSAGPVTPRVGVVDLLAKMKVAPEQVKYIGISHYHGDHIGQFASQSHAPDRQRGLGCANECQATDGRQSSVVSNWIGGGGNIEPVPQDKMSLATAPS
jgi:hypothetical protein